MSDDEEYYYYSDEDYNEGEDGAEKNESKSQAGGGGRGSLSRGGYARSSSSVEYTVLTNEDLMHEKNVLINEVSDVLETSPDRASVLLLHFRWNKEKLFDAYYADAEKTCHEAGAIQNEQLAENEKEQNKGKPFQCKIFSFEDGFKYEDTYSMGCTSKEEPGRLHRFSIQAWREYLCSKADGGGNAVFTRCPDDSGCTCVVSPLVWDRLLTPEGDDVSEEDKVRFSRALERYQKFLLNSFVDINAHIKWCPTPGCNRAVQGRGAVKDIHCTGCKAHWCFRCTLESHAPISCKALEYWIAKCNNESETANWILAHTKTCPKCSTRIEKNQGCNHMQCRVCRHDFCWVCLGPWSEHGTSTGGYYNCHIYKEGEKSNDKISAAKRELDRYLHYYQRYETHAQAGKFATRQREAAEQRMVELQAAENAGWIDVQFLEQAVETLIDCRRVLKYTYSLAYYLPKGAKKDLFEYHQSKLESYTEQLSELSEKPVEMLDRSEVINFTRVTAKFMDSLLASVENEGMAELATEVAINSGKSNSSTIDSSA